MLLKHLTVANNLAEEAANNQKVNKNLIFLK
jgi:hypothetical protein